MVAYTAPDCLPFFECTDSPCLNTGSQCEPSTVWCDLTARLDPILTSFDDVIARTANSFPFAKVARNAPQVVDTNVLNYDGMVHFDTVVADNNDLVDLDADNRFIIIRTPGIWHFEMYLYGYPPEVADNVMFAGIGQSTNSFLANMSTPYRMRQTYLRVGHKIAITNAAIATFNGYGVGIPVLYSGTTGNGLINITHAELTAYWTGDYP